MERPHGEEAILGAFQYMGAYWEQWSKRRKRPTSACSLEISAGPPSSGVMEVLNLDALTWEPQDLGLNLDLTLVDSMTLRNDFMSL